MSRSILLVLLLIFLGLIIQPAAGEVSGWEIIPENPAVGDGLKIRGNAEPGEEVGILVSFEKTVPVYLREYSYELDGIEILDFNNQVTVRAEGVEDLNVGWKMLFWKTNSSIARDGTATVSHTGIPPGNYQFNVGGYAEREATTVKLKISALQRVTTGSDGIFSYTYYTESLPAGDYEVKVGSSAKKVTLSPAGQGISEGPNPPRQGSLTIHPGENTAAEKDGAISVSGASVQDEFWEGNVPAEEKTRETGKSEGFSNISYLMAGVLTGLLFLAGISKTKKETKKGK